jgi:dTDP-4-dehydrorhamnose reductase/SAM-dependent methyltransferase
VKIAIYGAGGILGQTMRLYQPPLDVRYYRREKDFIHYGIDLTQENPDEFMPDVIVNLAGENRPDVVEMDPQRTFEINAEVPQRLAQWCDSNGAHYIHISTQAVFSGELPPYSPSSHLSAINIYGMQKIEAENRVRQFQNWTILRPTFVLGVRPLPLVGRPNPFEFMMTRPKGKEVNDRWFSPLFAREGAKAIWEIVKIQPKGRIHHLGTPARVSRYWIARHADRDVEPVNHNFFEGLAPRPVDTTYATGCLASIGLIGGLDQCRKDWDPTPHQELVTDLAVFFGISEAEARMKLGQGFAIHHANVAADFRAMNPQSDSELLEWYRQTEAYIWELGAYHLDGGFNYKGMVEGIVERLRGTEGSVLCLGDGIGDLTLQLRQAGIDAIYHDLRDSKTSEFAEFRFWRRFGADLPVFMSKGWEPNLNWKLRSLDGNGSIQNHLIKAVLCLDFLEHMPNVEAWVKAIREVLQPGGVALFQNAFNMGSGRDGSIPMHLTRNDRYEKDWTPLMQKTGFRQQGTSNWWEI